MGSNAVRSTTTANGSSAGSPAPARPSPTGARAASKRWRPAYRMWWPGPPRAWVAWTTAGIGTLPAGPLVAGAHLEDPFVNGSPRLKLGQSRGIHGSDSTATNPEWRRQMVHVVNSASDTFRGQHRFVARPQLVDRLVPRESPAGSTGRAARSTPVRRGAGVRGNPPSRSRSTVHVPAMSWWAGRDKMGNNERRLLLHPPRRQGAARCRRPAGEGAVDQRLEQVIAVVSRPEGHARRPSSWVCQTRPHLLVVAGPWYAHPPPGHHQSRADPHGCTVGGFGPLFGLGPTLWTNSSLVATSAAQHRRSSTPW